MTMLPLDPLMYICPHCGGCKGCFCPDATENRTMGTIPTTTPFYADLGSVSSGTMRPEDLIPIFMDAIRSLMKAEALLGALCGEGHIRLGNDLDELEQRMLADDYYDSEACPDDLVQLFDQLDEYAPPLCHFGAHPGDGCDYGFWLYSDAIEDAEADGELIKVDAGDDWPDGLGNAEYVAEVTDHGNVTLFDAHSHQELWAIV